MSGITFGENELRAICAKALKAADGDQAEAVVVARTGALTRFANAAIHQNVVSREAEPCPRTCPAGRRNEARLVDTVWYDADPGAGQAVPGEVGGVRGAQGDDRIEPWRERRGEGPSSRRQRERADEAMLDGYVRHGCLPRQHAADGMRARRS